MSNKKICIALCDDDIRTHIEIKDLLFDYEIKYKTNIELIEFYSAEELLSSKENFDILLLDYDMPGQDGISAGNKLRKKGNDCKIIMLTRMDSCYKDAFKIQAVRFVTKKIIPDELFEALNCAISSLKGNNKIELYRGNNKVMRPQRAIEYIQANGDFLKVFIENEVYFSNYSLEEMNKILDSRIFKRCHKSYIVNFENIEKIENDTIILDNGILLKIAKRRKKEFMKAFIEFDTKVR